MKKLIPIMLLLVCGCTKYELSPVKTEPATVTALYFRAAYTDTDVSVDANGGVTVDTTRIPADFGVGFQCQHGTFSVSGSSDHYASLWKRLAQGDKVTVYYQEKYRVKGTNRIFDDFVFIDAQKDPKAELDF